MTIEQKIRELKEHIIDYNIDDLTEMEWYFARYYAQTSLDLANAKKYKAERKLKIQSDLLEENEHTTQKEIDNRYYATEEGKFIVYQDIMLKSVGTLLSAIRSRKRELINIK